jgi:membrane protease subunit HflK
MNHPEPQSDPYRGVVIVLLTAALLGMVGGFYGGVQLNNPVLIGVAVTMALACGALTGVFFAQTMRARPPKQVEAAEVVTSETPEKPDGDARLPKWAVENLRSLLFTRLTAATRSTGQWVRDRGALDMIRLGTGVGGANVIFLLLFSNVSVYAPGIVPAGIAIALCLIAAGIAATAVRYLNAIDPARFPESPALCRGARAVFWMFVLAAVSVALAWADRQTAVQLISVLVLVLNAAFSYGLLTVKSSGDPVFPLDIGVLSVLGSRTNFLASILDSGERQMGIDLRSTWALSVIRQSLEPLVLGLFLVAWLSTSLTVVGLEEQGLVERLGIPVGGPPLLAGLHLHWPWLVDKVFRIPVRRVQALEVGHEGVEAPGPENVLWEVEHAPNEFTLLLGNGRDLITVDAGIQYRIVDAAAWRYHCQNPDQALSAIAYRAVMRNTVNLTLSDALSLNVALLTVRMRTMIQKEADALDLGVDILGFTVGGMHPAVAMATDYQAVVSAELRKVTTVVNAQVYRARALPASEASTLVSENEARAEGAEALGKAAGEAWSFRTLEAQYRASPNLYFFRRRLETLEKDLAYREFTIVDHRFQRDGGELWVMP